MNEKKQVHIVAQLRTRPQPKEGEIVETECVKYIPFVTAEGIPGAELCVGCKTGLKKTFATADLDEQAIYHCAEI